MCLGGVYLERKGWRRGNRRGSRRGFERGITSGLGDSSSGEGAEDRRGVKAEAGAGAGGGGGGIGEVGDPPAGNPPAFTRFVGGVSSLLSSRCLLKVTLTDRNIFSLGLRRR